jgi:hypothetical protein
MDALSVAAPVRGQTDKVIAVLSLVSRIPWPLRSSRSPGNLRGARITREVGGARHAHRGAAWPPGKEARARAGFVPREPHGQGPPWASRWLGSPAGRRDGETGLVESGDEAGLAVMLSAQ